MSTKLSLTGGSITSENSSSIVNLSKYSALSFFSAALITLIPLRAFVDRLGFGFAVGIILLAIFVLRMAILKSFSRKILFIFMLFVLPITYGFIVAVYNFELPFYSMRGVIRFLLYFAVFFIAYYSNLSINSLYKAYTLVVIVQIVSCLFQYFVMEVDRRLYGTLINSNHVSYLIVPYFSLCLVYYRQYVRSFFIFLFGVFLGGMGGAISLLIVSILYFLFTVRLKYKLLGALALSVFITIAVSTQTERIDEQVQGMSNIHERIETGRPGGSGSLLWRVVTWRLMVDELVERGGLVQGMGIEYASLASPYFLSASIREPHNDYVRVLLEFGVIGLVLYVSLALKLVFFFLKVARYSALARSMLFALIALSAAQFVGNILTQSTLWWFIAAIIGVYLRERWRLNEK
ncbi:O-antigen ligase family protein [Desulfurispirillum indicum]|uniref:O-antigen ligase family protein n=1 Tax=Desulfurispirillum indicum TaxID=936456 RepID=UPI001CF9FC5C|nr:O-antigen ligase family protein [Desulfurispirillum indicum]UCZ56527.1 O-antigen ligase family protein [Desulfurispirillum indicum]